MCQLHGSSPAKKPGQLTRSWISYRVAACCPGWLTLAGTRAFLLLIAQPLRMLAQHSMQKTFSLFAGADLPQLQRKDA